MVSEFEAADKVLLWRDFCRFDKKSTRTVNWVHIWPKTLFVTLTSEIRLLLGNQVSILNMNGCFVHNLAGWKSKLQLKIRLNIRNFKFKFSQNLTASLIISFETDKNVCRKRFWCWWHSQIDDKLSTIFSVNLQDKMVWKLISNNFRKILNCLERNHLTMKHRLLVGCSLVHKLR